MRAVLEDFLGSIFEMSMAIKHFYVAEEQNNL